MKKTLPSLLFFAVIGGMIIWNISTTSKDPSQISEEVDLAVNAASSPWPFLREDASETVLSDNLLATNIYVVFDGSGSMAASACSGQQEKIAAAKQALQEFVKSIPASANVGMVTFDVAGTHEKVPLNQVNYNQMNEMISAVRAGGGTPLSSAIDVAYAALTQQARKQLGYGEYHLLVVTDGQASDGFEPDRNLNRILKDSPLVVHTIGFCIGDDHSLNQPGRTFYSTAQDYESLRRGLQGVLAESPEFTVSDFD